MARESRDVEREDQAGRKGTRQSPRPGDRKGHGSFRFRMLQLEQSVVGSEPREWAVAYTAFYSVEHRWVRDGKVLEAGEPGRRLNCCKR